jgi:hypothetical protein
MRKILFSFLSVCHLQSMYLLISLPPPFLYLRSLVSCILYLPFLSLFPKFLFLSLSNISIFFLFAHTLIPFETVSSYSCLFQFCLFSPLLTLFFCTSLTHTLIPSYLSPTLFLSFFPFISLTLRLCIFISLPLSAPNVR